MHAPPRRVLIVANPYAGLRRGRDAGADAARAAEGTGRGVDLHRTSGPGDARRAAASAAAQAYDLVVAVGGDGTAHEAANGLLGTTTALAVAPAGTMNLLARLLGLPLDPAEAAALAVRLGRRRVVRPGIAGAVAFLLMAGIGFDAWVLRELLERGRKIGFGSYARGAFAALSRYPYPNLSLLHREGVVSGHSAIVGRSPLYGGFLRPTPRCRLEDPRLEMCAFQGRSGSMLRLVPALWSGDHLGRPGVVSAIVERIEASSDSPDVPVQLDGEIAGQLPMTFSIATETLVLAA